MPGLEVTDAAAVAAFVKAEEQHKAIPPGGGKGNPAFFTLSKDQAAVFLRFQHDRMRAFQVLLLEAGP